MVIYYYKGIGYKVKKCEYCAKEISYHEMYCCDKCEEQAKRFFELREKYQKLFSVLNGIFVMAIGISIFLYSFLRDAGCIAGSTSAMVLGLMYFFLPYPPDVMIQKYKLEKAIKITRIIAVVLFCLGLLVLIFYLTGVL